MGYRTVRHVPRCTNYANAKRIHDQITPIRGRTPEIRPLGQRRDADEYWARMDGDVVEFVLYKTPVIRFHPEGDIEITVANWSTASTHQFIWHVLNLRAMGRAGKTVIDFRPEKVAIDPSSSLLVRMVEGKLKPVDAKPLDGYAVNRKAMNKVKAQYKEFIQYVKGFEALRVHDTEIIHNKGTPYEVRFSYPTVEYSIQEAVDALGIALKENTPLRDNQQIKTRAYVDTYAWSYALHLPQEHNRQNAEAFKRLGHKQMEAFMRLCANDQPEEDKHTNFHKAVMVMLTYTHWLGADDGDLTNIRSVRNPKLLAMFEGVMKRHHRAEYLDKVQLKNGALPNTTYMLWMQEV